MIDLRSDTITKPTPAMRTAMYEAEVGDDVYEEDPTVRHLEEYAAQRLGKEAALFVTSGTQGNQVAVLSHCRPGDEIILDKDSHLFYYEVGAIASLAGVQTNILPSQQGQMDIAAMRQAIRPEDIHLPRTSLIGIENTHNRAGGVVLPLGYMKQVYELAQEYKVPVHLDGARIFNAAVALGVELREITQYVDTVQVCLSKGLSAPIGSLVAGPKEWIERARKWRKALGGGMRQAGVIAAPGLIALQEMIERLQEDHNQAKTLAQGLANIDGIEVNADEVETNIVLFNTEGLGLTAAEMMEKLKEKGLLANPYGPYTVRLMTYREITDEQIDEAIHIIDEIAQEQKE